MKKNSYIFALTISMLLLGQSAFAQYKNAVGGRFGTANGITFKTFTKKNQAFDFILNFQSSTNYSNFRFTGLYEIQHNFADVDGLQWYYGFGGTLGSRTYKPTNEHDLILAADGVIGLDFKFRDAPINVALDWKPAIEISPNTSFNGESLGLSLRFTF